MTTFTDTEFMTADEKAKVYRNWCGFVDGRFKRAHFTKALYKHLTLHCSFIAHYDINGFYGVYFTKPERTDKFIKQFDRAMGARSTEYGNNYWLDGDYADINNAMVDYMGSCLDVIRNKNKAQQIANLEAQIADLQVKLSQLRR